MPKVYIKFLPLYYDITTLTLFTLEFLVYEKTKF